MSCKGPSCYRGWHHLPRPIPTCEWLGPRSSSLRPPRTLATSKHSFSAFREVSFFRNLIVRAKPHPHRNPFQGPEKEGAVAADREPGNPDATGDSAQSYQTRFVFDYQNFKNYSKATLNRFNRLRPRPLKPGVLRNTYYLLAGPRPTVLRLCNSNLLGRKKSKTTSGLARRRDNRQANPADRATNPFPWPLSRVCRQSVAAQYEQIHKEVPPGVQTNGRDEEWPHDGPPAVIFALDSPKPRIEPLVVENRDEREYGRAPPGKAGCRLRCDARRPRSTPGQMAKPGKIGGIQHVALLEGPVAAILKAEPL